MRIAFWAVGVYLYLLVATQFAISVAMASNRAHPQAADRPKTWDLVMCGVFWPIYMSYALWGGFFSAIREVMKSE